MRVGKQVYLHLSCFLCFLTLGPLFLGKFAMTLAAVSLPLGIPIETTTIFALQISLINAKRWGLGRVHVFTEINH